jgi:hypothetical protein
MDPDHRVHAAGGERRQVQEGAEPAVPHQDVAGPEVGMDVPDPCHLVGPQRRREDLQQQPGAGVAPGPDPGHREAAPGPGPSRGPEVGPQLGRVGHRERRAIDQERPGAAPGALRPGLRDEAPVEAAEHGPVDRQREPCPRLAEGRVGERAAGHQRDVVQGGVAVEDLDDEPAEDGDGGQEAVAPAVPGVAAGVVDGGLVEAGGEILPERSQGGENPVLHRGASGMKVSFSSLNVTDGPSMLKSQCGQGLALA